MTSLATAPALNVALLQTAGTLARPGANLAELEAACAGCAAAGDDLLVTPELFLSGYNLGDAAPGLGVQRDDALLGRIAALAARFDVGLCVGYPERAGDALFNSAVLVGRDGRVLGHYRKHRPSGEYETATFARGDGADLVVSVDGLRVGVLICYDVEFPENVRRLARAGVKLVLVPTALSEEFDFVARKLVPTRAFENGVFVAYADRCGAEGDKRYAGSSCVVAPDGTDLARAGADPGIVRARVEPGRYAALAERLPYLRDLEAG